MRKSIFSLFLCALAAATLVGCGKGDSTAASTGGGSTGSSSAPDANKTYDLKINLNKGDKMAYDIKMSMNADLTELIQKNPAAAEQLKGMGDTHTIALTLTENDEVTEAADGKFTINTSYTDAKTEAKGMFEKNKDNIASSFKPETTTVDSRGQRADGKTQGMPGLPDKPVKIGDTWDATAKGSTDKIMGKVVGVENMNGKETVKVEYSGTKMGDLPLDGPLTMWIDTATGIPVKISGKLKADQEGVHMTGDLERTLRS